jgi:hypothetical protein
LFLLLGFLPNNESWKGLGLTSRTYLKKRMAYSGIISGNLDLTASYTARKIQSFRQLDTGIISEALQ